VPDVSAPPGQFPIPPSAGGSGTTGEHIDPGAHIAPSTGVTGTTEVPTWAFRAPSNTGLVQLPTGGFGPPGQPYANPATTGDLTLDPMSLRRRVSIRSGMRALVVDDHQLVLRSWWKRTEMSWQQIHGFELRFDSAGGSGHLVAITTNGPVELPTTKRSVSDLRYVHALLDAYRIRAQLLAPGH